MPEGNRASRYTHSDATDDLLAITGVDSAADNFVNRGLFPAGSSWYAHTDHQGSLRAVTGDAGTVINQYSYDAYGNAETATESLPQLFRYTAREYDPDTGLYHYRARAYDPSTGRFLQEDPIGFEAGDLNVYRYTWNNPANWVDPSGLMAIEYRVLLGMTTGAILANFAIQHAVESPVFKSGLKAAMAGLNLQGGAVQGWLLVGIAAEVQSVMMDKLFELDSGGFVFETGQYGVTESYIPPDDPCKQWRKLIDEHRQKLNQYKGDPYSMDNLGELAAARDAGNWTRWNSIYNGRINNLSRTIDRHTRNLKACLDQQ